MENLKHMITNYELSSLTVLKMNVLELFSGFLNTSVETTPTSLARFQSKNRCFTILVIKLLKKKNTCCCFRCFCYSIHSGIRVYAILWKAFHLV